MKVRAPIAKLEEGEHALDPEASRYLHRVLRLGAGARFVAFDPEARREADATIIGIDDADAIRVRIEALREGEVVANVELAIIYALSKGDKVDDVVRDATELGATRIVIAQTQRSVVKALGDQERAASKKERWKRIVEQAARQCGRSDPPLVEGVVGWDEALALASDCEARFCLDPRAVQTLGDPLRDAIENGRSLAFAIGPEGGLSSSEIESAAHHGWLPVTLGMFVLRTETVTAAVLGAVRVFSR